MKEDQEQYWKKKKKNNSSDYGTSNLDNRAYFYTQFLNPYWLVGAQETIVASIIVSWRNFSSVYVRNLPP